MSGPWCARWRSQSPPAAQTSSPISPGTPPARASNPPASVKGAKTSAQRTEDPADGERLALPDMSHVVQHVAAQFPDALRGSCQDHGGSWEFMDRLVDELRTHDTRWGYNWKRGNVGDPSKDVVDYHLGRRRGREQHRRLHRRCDQRSLR